MLCSTGRRLGLHAFHGLGLWLEDCARHTCSPQLRSSSSCSCWLCQELHWLPALALHQPGQVLRGLAAHKCHACLFTVSGSCLAADQHAASCLCYSCGARPYSFRPGQSAVSWYRRHHPGRAAPSIQAVVVAAAIDAALTAADGNGCSCPQSIIYGPPADAPIRAAKSLTLRGTALPSSTSNESASSGSWPASQHL